MTITKRTTYEQGIARIDDALKHKYWLEASWITYAMLEDRCDSLLEKSGGSIPSQPNGFVSINKKIRELKRRCSNHQLLGQFFELSSLLDEAHGWKERRNPIMHSMVEMPRQWESINQDARQLAIDGRDLLGRFSAVAMRIRKKYIKAGQTA